MTNLLSGPSMGTENWDAEGDNGAKESEDILQKKKERQVDSLDYTSACLIELLQKLLDDIGVVVAMVVITLLAVVVVGIRCAIMYTEVKEVTNNQHLQSASKKSNHFCFATKRLEKYFYAF